MDIHRAIKHIAEENNGIIRANDMVKAGLRREILARLAKDGVLDKEGRGIYVLSGEWPDE